MNWDKWEKFYWGTFPFFVRTKGKRIEVFAGIEKCWSGN